MKIHIHLIEFCCLVSSFAHSILYVAVALDYVSKFNLWINYPEEYFSKNIIIKKLWVFAVDWGLRLCATPPSIRWYASALCKRTEKHSSFISSWPTFNANVMLISPPPHTKTTKNLMKYCDRMACMLPDQLTRSIF